MENLNQLLELSAEKHQPAFKKLYEQTSPKLYSLALRYMKRPSLAEEVLQESYIKIWDKASRYDSSQGNAIAWMSVITRNTALDTKRSFTSRPEEVESTYEGEDFVASDINLSIESQTDFVEEIKNLDKCLNKLNAEQRKCIIFSRIYGYTHQELSHIMGKPLGTIKTWINRGSDQLLACKLEFITVLRYSVFSFLKLGL